MPPLNLLIKPASSLCNMRCKYCFYSDVSDNREIKSFGMMSLETLENLVKKGLAEADKFVTFGFQGGEPTLVGLDFYEKLLEFQKKYNFKNLTINNSIQTNGYAVDAQWAKFFADNNFLVGLSVDGTKDIHNSSRIDAAGKPTYNKVMKAAELFDKYNVQYNILCVVNNFVARKPLMVYNNLKKYKFLQFIPCLDGFDGVKNEYSLTNERYLEFLKVTFDEYYKDFMKNDYVSVRNFDNYINIITGHQPESCAMNGFCSCYFVIEGDGSAYPCDFYVLDEWKLGNVNEDFFNDMLKSPVAKRFVETSVQKPQECKECKYYSLCRGGCRREREPMVQETMGLNRLCESYKAFFDYSCEKMVEIARELSKK